MSSFPAAIGTTPDPVLVPIFLELVRRTMRRARVAEADPYDAYSTYLATLGSISAAIGIVLVTCSAFRLGQLGKYIPYPVAVGFVASSGILIVQVRARAAVGGGMWRASAGPRRVAAALTASGLGIAH